MHLNQVVPCFTSTYVHANSPLDQPKYLGMIVIVFPKVKYEDHIEYHKS